jgi:hypothetical protein
MKPSLRLRAMALSVAAFGLNGICAYAQSPAVEEPSRGALQQFVDAHMGLAFGIVALIAFTAGAVLSHLRNK